MKQTAVEWLVDKLEIFATEQEMNIIEQAKEMEKEQIISAFIEGNLSDLGCGSEQYYNETFKSE
jgi:hypothetical protein